ncbi:Mitochondrial import inner membrane translocase subunit tim23 [Porphyridium purpureum]|uniref:Mitochondrial import inner membrane translocase subunit tim23 n=1 Tax=Porphyridium purpureum TaxID=35688 RepID=A0A5J4ZAE8_PORPP|nr:Mitochondrial import inner membrane translocase subunit tim23 [Porphyridium purpureum]|eukprot:POR7773..scf295_1
MSFWPFGGDAKPSSSSSYDARSPRGSSEFGSLSLDDDEDAFHSLGLAPPMSEVDMSSLSGSDAGYSSFPSGMADGSPSINFGTLGSIQGAKVAPVFGGLGLGGAGGSSAAPYNSKGLDYLFQEEFYEYRKKGWGEQITYSCAITYLSGVAVGGTRGLVEALKSSRGKPFKLVLNAALNNVGKRSAAYGQSMAVCAFMFANIETLIYNYRSDELPENYLLAGALTGALFKSTRGLKQMGIWGAGLGAIGLGVIYASRQGVYGRSIQGLL